MATAIMQYRDDGFVTITSYVAGYEVKAPTLRARNWGIRQLKREATHLGITLKKKNGLWCCADYQKMMDAEYRLFEALKKCWVSPTDRELRKAVGFKGRNILDF